MCQASSRDTVYQKQRPFVRVLKKPYSKVNGGVVYSGAGNLLPFCQDMKNMKKPFKKGLTQYV